MIKRLTLNFPHGLDPFLADRIARYIQILADARVSSGGINLHDIESMSYDYTPTSRGSAEERERDSAYLAGEFGIARS